MPNLGANACAIVGCLAQRVRIGLLCPELRRVAGGVGDLEAPVNEIAALPISPTHAIIVENLETGLALPERRGTVCVMKLGRAVGVLAQLPWL